jgi:hypothetical protein
MDSIKHRTMIDGYWQMIEQNCFKTADGNLKSFRQMHQKINEKIATNISLNIWSWNDNSTNLISLEKDWTLRWPYRPTQFQGLIGVASKLSVLLKSNCLTLELGLSAPNPEGSVSSQPLCSLPIAFYQISICQRTSLPPLHRGRHCESPNL